MCNVKSFSVRVSTEVVLLVMIENDIVVWLRCRYSSLSSGSQKWYRTAVGGVGGVGGISNRYTVTTRMISGLRRAAM